jgi:hypothetical protein
VEWSVGLLADAERSLLEIAAVFVDGWTAAAAARVAGLDEDDVLDRSEALARHSLIYLDDGPRLRMLETIRAFMAERLAARPDAAEIRRRHADHYRTLTEWADRPLRGAGQREWCQRLDADEGNLAAAVRWYLDNDPEPLPHLFRILWLFWFLRDHLGEAHSWVGRLLPAADSLNLEAQVELASTAAATALEVGDDEMVLSAQQRLTPLLDLVEDRTCARCPGWSRPGRPGSPATSTARWQTSRTPWSRSGPKASCSGQRSPRTPPAWWRRPSAGTTTRCAT